MARRIYIIWSRPLFHETLAILLKHPTIEVVGAHPRVAGQDIDSLQPDTLIIEEADDEPISDASITQLLETTPSLLRVIRLSLEDNVLKIVHREQYIIRQTEDLLRFLRED